MGDQASPGELPPSASAEEVPIVLLLDVSTNQTLAARNSDRRFIPASITKVMTAYVAFEKLAAKQIDLRQRVVVNADIAEEWGGVGSTMFLEVGDVATVEELLRGITAVSANDGAIVLATHGAGSVDKWVAEMNAAARKLGMRNSHFGTPNGWMDGGATFTTARDLAILAKALTTRHPALYNHFFGREGFSFNGIAQANHDPLVGKVEGADGIKTGFTNEAGYGFLGSAIRDGRRLVVVTAAAPTGRGRNKAAIDLVEWGFDAFSTKRLFAKDTLVGAAEVQNGASATVDLVAEQQIHASLPRGTSASDVSLSIKYLGPIPAPVAKGEQIAELEVSIAGHGSHRIPLVAAEDVAEAGFWTRLWNGVRGIVT
ncbi:D-alanyl-D-alanine carboxypeptidase family protein [Alteriqipengyuania sp. WL0013]|uniref:D-alanyl-D-alanine carboxypeptidase family protein n=1 Tax=Alteriqipengyuania sp. WL0013 TaxID=3110773 RepID=UPI002CD5FC45|nr:D-alanyl-D-alanine carboxypeptidase family protein [Alteriqipengyuania sp. WL0013]MEB3414915.1 D-alanyl-D-alanine carboxypeptidase family protein [Alteriqipengyuania sp. WL0013]